MRFPASAPQPRFVHPMLFRFARPATAARHRLRHRATIAFSLLLLSLLLPGGHVLARDLPSVQLIAASADSAEAHVDLSTPIAISSRPKWTGYLEFLGKPGTARSIGQPDLFLPVLQDANDLTFFNLRGQLQFDHTDNSEYNVGLGHRHMFQEWIFGGYGYFDHRNTQYGSQFNQFTGGLEALSVNWAMRVNGYLPENKTTTFTGDANMSVITPGDQIKIQVNGLIQEKALPGVDGEVGYMLPLPWATDDQLIHETWLFVGGYHFFGQDQFASISGPRGRLEMRIYDLPVLGPGSRFMMGVEGQYDEPRGGQAFGLVSLRIPFDVFADTSRRRALTGLDRRMVQPIIRDVDVVAGEVDMPMETLPALNQAGDAYTKYVEVDVTDQAEVQGALNTANDPAEVTLIIPKMNGGTISLDSLLTLHEGQTLGGENLTVSYNSSTLGFGKIGYNPGGAIAGLKASEVWVGNRLIDMAPDTEINGLTLDATEKPDYVLRVNMTGNKDAPGTRWVAYSHLKDSVEQVLWARGLGADIRIDYSRISGGLRGVQLWEATVHISNSRIYDNDQQGLVGYKDSQLTVSDSRIYDNGTDGIEVYNGATANIFRSYIYDNGHRGVDSHSGGTTINIFNSYIYDNSHEGVFVTAGAMANIEDTIITQNGWDGVSTYIGANFLAGNISIKRSVISNNGRYGVASRYGSTVTIEDSVVTGNGYYGLLAESWAGDVLPVDGSGGNPPLGPERFQDLPSSILKATNVIVSGNGRKKAGGGYGVLNRGGEITLIQSRVFDNEGEDYRNEAGLLRQDSPEFVDFLGKRGDDNDGCLRHDGTITVDGHLIGAPLIVLPDPGCTVWPSP